MTKAQLVRNYFVWNWSQELKLEGWWAENWHWRVRPLQTMTMKMVDQVFGPTKEIEKINFIQE